MKRSSRRTASRSRSSKRRNRKHVAAGIAAVCVFAILFLIPRIQGGEGTLFQKKPEPVRIVFVGDIMLDRGVRGNVTKHLAGDYGKLFEHTAYLADADIAFGNLEGPVATGGRNVGSRFSFRMEPTALSAMRDAGFDVVSFANNHVGDYSTTAFRETLSFLKQYNIKVSGAGENITEAAAPAIIDVRGTTVGFLSATDVGPTWLRATDTAPGILIAADALMAERIRAADPLVDVLVVSFHWGDEYSPANARQEELAKMAIDAGADIVVGHHPHVMQKVERYNGKLVYYSLGNFIFDQYFSEHTMRGMVAEVLIDSETKEVSSTEYVVPLSRQYVPQERVPYDPSMLLTKRFTP